MSRSVDTTLNACKVSPAYTFKACITSFNTKTGVEIVAFLVNICPSGKPLKAELLSTFPLFLNVAMLGISSPLILKVIFTYHLQV